MIIWWSPPPPPSSSAIISQRAALHHFLVCRTQANPPTLISLCIDLFSQRLPYDLGKFADAWLELSKRTKCESESSDVFLPGTTNEASNDWICRREWKGGGGGRKEMENEPLPEMEKSCFACFFFFNQKLPAICCRLIGIETMPTHATSGDPYIVSEEWSGLFGRLPASNQARSWLWLNTMSENGFWPEQDRWKQIKQAMEKLWVSTEAIRKFGMEINFVQFSIIRNLRN